MSPGGGLMCKCIHSNGPPVDMFAAILCSRHEQGHVAMVTSSNGNIFRVTGPLSGEFTGHRWTPLTKASDAELWCFLWSLPWINGWVNNREAGDLRGHRTHYDVMVMRPKLVTSNKLLYRSIVMNESTHWGLATLRLSELGHHWYT